MITGGVNHGMEMHLDGIKMLPYAGINRIRFKGFVLSHSVVCSTAGPQVHP
jgi:hypothetical protein